jgi:hypothetical protein
MHERASHREALRAGVPVTLERVTLLPIERVVLQACHGKAGLWLSGAKQPYALIVRDAGGTRALGVEAAAISMEGLCASVPGLAAVLAAL